MSSPNYLFDQLRQVRKAQRRASKNSTFAPSSLTNTDEMTRSSHFSAAC
jgi:hypothetical protein